MDWLRLLPPFARRHLSDSPNRQEIVINSTWLISDKLLRLVVGIFVSAFIARYLGPQRFGLLSYAVAFVSLFSVFAGLGLENIVVRELVKRPASEKRILGTAFLLQFTAGLLTWGSVLAVVALLPDRVEGAFWLTAIIAASLLFHSTRVIEFYFRSRVEGRFIVRAKVVPFLIISSYKIFLVLKGAGLQAFAFAFTLEAALEAFGLVSMYKWQGKKPTRFRFDRGIALETLSESWPLLLSGFSVMVYMKIDQIMLGQMRGAFEVGLYAAAVRISEAWYFIPMFLTQSSFPIIVRSREENRNLYYKRLQNLFTVNCMTAYLIIFMLVLFSRPIVVTLFGQNYAASANVIVVHVWAGLFLGLGVVQNSWLVTEGLTKISLFRATLGAVTNIILNLFLIPPLGIMGAAIATLVAQILATTLSNLAFRATRPIFVMQLKGLGCVIRKSD